jgi:hypothetical protein
LTSPMEYSSPIACREKYASIRRLRKALHPHRPTGFRSGLYGNGSRIAAR